LVESEPQTINKILDIAIQICEGLATAHEKGIVHRDIKSENIIITPKGQAKITDFGLAKVRGATKLTKEGSTLGTAAYMSPEQARGEEVDHRSDIFSFGVVLYELLTGRLPFRGEHQAALMFSIVNEEPEPIARFNERASNEIGHIVAKALEKDKEDRYQHADDLLSDLRRERKKLDYAKASTITVTAQSALRGSLKIRLRRIGVIIAAVSVVVVLAVIFNPFNLQIGMQKSLSEGRKSIAVLPFQDVGQKEGPDDFFSEGIAEDISVRIGKIGELKVIARSSVLKYKGTAKNVKDIAKELGVSTILEGTVRRSGNRLHVVCELIDGQTEEQLWSESYDCERKANDIFEIQADVAEKIASSLKASFSTAVGQSLKAKPTENLAAYAFYVKGREYYYRYKKYDNETAIGFFKKAIELDSNYALAYAGLGDAYAQRWEFGDGRSIDSSIAVCQRSIALDPNNAEAYKALGLAYEVSGRLQEALTTNMKAVELNPNFAPALGNIGDVYCKMGQLVEGIRWRTKALQADPAFARSYAMLAAWYMTLTEDEKAQQLLKRSLELQPDNPSAYGNQGYLYLCTGRFRDALRAFEIKCSFDGDTTGYYDVAAFVYLSMNDTINARAYAQKLPYEKSWFGLYLDGRKGRRREVQRYCDSTIVGIKQLIDKGDESYLPRLRIAHLFGIEERKAEALEWLRKDIEAGDVDYRYMQVDPFLRILHGDPQFEKMIASLKARVDEMKRQVREMNNK
jgi:TolB-like protein/Flp pilus assembly protein TadD